MPHCHFSLQTIFTNPQLVSLIYVILSRCYTFNEEVILDKLNNLKVNKSPGPDSLHPRVLSELRYQLITPLHLIFDTSYNTGCILSDWKFANTVPVYKKGRKAECNNYRPGTRFPKFLKKILRKS